MKNFGLLVDGLTVLPCVLAWLSYSTPFNARGPCFLNIYVKLHLDPTSKPKEINVSNAKRIKTGLGWGHYLEFSDWSQVGIIIQFYYRSCRWLFWPFPTGLGLSYFLFWHVQAVTIFVIFDRSKVRLFFHYSDSSGVGLFGVFWQVQGKAIFAFL